MLIFVKTIFNYNVSIVLTKRTIFKINIIIITNFKKYVIKNNIKKLKKLIYLIKKNKLIIKN